ncbi:MAG: hypothetical protein OEU92_19355 [Alphaproteobacteria bacterium]|nr:hypothetical protein [Alphaproteobacteria bacterium]
MRLRGDPVLRALFGAEDETDADDQSCRISGALGQDLGAHRTLCLQAGLARDPELASDLLLYMLVRDVLRCGGYWDKPSEITARPAHLTSSQSDLEDTPAAKELAAIRQALPMSFAMFPPREQMEKDPRTVGRGQGQPSCGMHGARPHRSVGGPRSTPQRGARFCSGRAWR